MDFLSYEMRRNMYVLTLIFVFATDLEQNEVIVNNNDDLCLSMETSPNNDML